VSAAASFLPEKKFGPILVTGATGFIGTHVVEHFADRGEEVVALRRRQDSLAIEGARMATVPDLLDRMSLRKALDGVQTVIHLAGRVHARKEGRDDPDSECRRVNVEGTRALLEESIESGIQHFLFVSSVKAAATESRTIVDETTPPMPGDAYGASKLEAERLVRVLARRESLHAPVLRLPLVYGPGMKSNMLSLYRAVERGIPLPLSSVRNRRSFIYVGNVIEAMESLLGTPSAAQETFFASDGMDLSTPELVKRIAASVNRRPRLFPVPVPALRALGGAGYLLSRILPFHFTLDSLSALVGSLFVDISKIQKMTGYQPAISVDEGLARTARGSRAAALASRQ
jgi:nucleoside-diphosphate-sugar epimerase